MTADETHGKSHGEGTHDRTRDERGLAAYLEGELAEAEAAAWDEHLLGCDSCWDAVKEAQLGRVLAASLRHPAPASLRTRVELAVAAATRSRRPPRARWPRRAIAVAAVAAAVTIVAVGGLLAVGAGRDDRRDGSEPIAVVLQLAANRDETPPPARDGVMFRRLSVEGHDVVLARSERPFPMPEGAVALADDPHSPWLATRDDVSLLCFSQPAPVLLAGRASPETLAEIAATLGLTPTR